MVTDLRRGIDSEGGGGAVSLTDQHVRGTLEDKEV